MRACCFEWLVGLVTKDLWLDHTPSERGAILEAVATLVERCAVPPSHLRLVDPFLTSLLVLASARRCRSGRLPLTQQTQPSFARSSVRSSPLS